ncbi:MAG: hypothetical protein WBB29_22225 [Geitlerinemataceae cyanobacterium]
MSGLGAFIGAIVGGQDEGWLVVFDSRDNVPELEERLKTEIQVILING